CRATITIKYSVSFASSCILTHQNSSCVNRRSARTGDRYSSSSTEARDCSWSSSSSERSRLVDVYSSSSCATVSIRDGVSFKTSSSRYSSITSVRSSSTIHHEAYSSSTTEASDR